MADKLYEESNIQAIANAIRAKGQSGTMTVAQMPTKIAGIQTGIEPISASMNVQNSDVTAYLTAASNYGSSSASVVDDVSGGHYIYIGNHNDKPASYNSGKTDLTVIDDKVFKFSDGIVVNVAPSSNGLDFFAKTNSVIDTVGHLSVGGTVRMIKTSCVGNFRDIGGWNCDGGNVKYGKIFRSAMESTSATQADINTVVNQLGITTEINITGDPHNTPIFEGTERLNYSITGYSADTYLDMVDIDKGNYANLKTVIQKFFYNTTNNKPLFVHCQLGADRTGIVALILESLLGVSEADIDKDYELTSFYSAATLRTRELQKYIDLKNYFKSCSTVNTLQEGVIAWCVLAGISIGDINTFRNNMSTGTPSDVAAHISYEATSISLNASTLDLSAGGSNTLVATLKPSRATSTVTWSTSDSSKATVTQNGVVTAVAAGSATITATANGHSATCSVTVTQATSYSITNNLTNVTTNNGATTVIQNNPYTATLSVQTSYRFDSVTVTMGGADVTSTVYDSSTHIISIASVTGNLIITASASAISYTNLFDYTTATANTRWNSAGSSTSTLNGNFIGELDLSNVDKSGDLVLYVKGAVPYEYTTGKYSYWFFYVGTSQQAVIRSLGQSKTTTGYYCPTFLNESHLYYSIDLKHYSNGDAIAYDWSNVKKLKFTTPANKTGDAITSADLQNVIMTINEPIE